MNYLDGVSKLKTRIVMSMTLLISKYFKIISKLITNFVFDAD